MQHNEPGSGPGGFLAGRPALPIIGGAVVAVVVLVIIAVVALGGGGNDTVEDSPHAGLADTDASETPVVEATIDLNRPTAVATNLTEVGADDRMIIPKYGVEAPLTYRTVGLDGVMPDPEGPDDVAYYDFTAWPGKGGAPGRGGNSVFAGHVDSGRKACKNGTVQPPCEAVFWDITRLRLGDEIQIRVAGQTTTYRVTSNQPIPAATGPWDQIVSATSQESITLITCGGDFNRETREYNNRQVVTAVRV